MRVLFADDDVIARTLLAAVLTHLGHESRGAEDGERSIDIRVTRLRRKIEIDPHQPSLIQTVRGEGYMFVPAAS